MPTRLKVFVSVVWLKANRAWAKASHADVYLENSKTENLARYGRARWPF